MINEDNTYMVNPAYKFRSDIKRVVLTNSDSLIYSDMEFYDDNGGKVSFFKTIVHPLIAYLFTFFDGSKNFRNVIEEISAIVEQPYEMVKQSFIPFIENQEEFYYLINDNLYAPIPNRFLILKTSDIPTRDLINKIDFESMMNNLDLSTMRYYIPDSIDLMLTTKCITDCVYCYADKQPVKNPLTFDRIVELIKEASELGCRDFGIIGGDVLLYEKWSSLINILHEYNYEPYLSTKTPLNENQILELKKAKIKRIQISIDTIKNNIAMEMLHVKKDYLDKLKQTLYLLNKHEIKIRVKSVITKYNDNINDVSELIKYLQDFEHLENLSIAPGEYSSYKSFDDYKTNKTNFSKIMDYVIEENKKDKRITASRIMSFDYNKPIIEKFKEHNNRATCSGNESSFFILPDGKVTLCEQLYWNPYFIIGDLSKQSIMEVWNSPKAMSLWNISQDEIKESSPCKHCNIFEDCRRKRGICWRMAVQAYGNENWDYPYPQCPYAEEPQKTFYL